MYLTFEKMLDNRYTLVEGISTLIYVLGQETYFPFNGNCYNKCGCSGNKTSYICGAVTFCRSVRRSLFYLFISAVIMYRSISLHLHTILN